MIPGAAADGDNGTSLLNRQRGVRLRAAELRALRAYLARLERDVAGGRPFTLCLVSDPAMRRLNRQFRGKNSPTDVLSFDDGGEGDDGRAGDLAVSVETAQRQARRLGHSLEAEIRILALHGLLHLLGYDHDAPRDAGRMARAERHWRRRLALPPALIERVSARSKA